MPVTRSTVTFERSGGKWIGALPIYLVAEILTRSQNSRNFIGACVYTRRAGDCRQQVRAMTAYLPTNNMSGMRGLLSRLLTLRVLGLSRCNLGDKEMTTLNKVWRGFLTLRVLDLSQNWLTARSVQAFVRSTRRSRLLRTLRVIQLEENELRADAIAALVALVGTASLRRMDVAYNIFGPEQVADVLAARLDSTPQPDQWGYLHANGCLIRLSDLAFGVVSI